ncbi:alanine--tRNA ligase [Aciditerrimonas ferrireducens]|uniref:alanine--tRNA ligase n=1 Tax=Aciditerrimonas ferrireducens TaxID=667306 RepID=UPI002002BDBB|nr:alanine--tRNA ligase [Aciditerrimonas ferrireducens]MCK4177202.1 alanine--tRNA ligase [Aciditerrimonas ferrireducens]
MDAPGLRRAFLGFYQERGHQVVPSASLVPHDPTVLFTIAGMVPFKPYFTGEEPAPWPRATSVQKCLRTVDIEVVGTTERHCTFFEMLGNFSFGDYFKERAIPYAWELLTGTLGLDPERLWVTVHLEDEEAETIWREAVGVPAERIQRMGEDNFWRMGDTGPCGPCSEVYYDRGPEHGPAGGPAAGGPERFVELYNLVFMQFDRQVDGSLPPLPRPSIDTGAGLERLLPILEGVPSLFLTSVFAPVLEAAQSVTGARYGQDPRHDVSLRILADHARAATLVVADGVLPGKEGRGYVLRRLVRRAVRHAHQLGVEDPLMARLAGAVADALGDAYPEVRTRLDAVAETLDREEAAFRRTLEQGSALLAEELARGQGVISGETAFRLHDTHGFPVELTVELAEEAGARVDLEGFAQAMAAQRARARADAARRRSAGDQAVYRDLLEERGPTRFTGYEHAQEAAQVVAVLPTEQAGVVEVVLDRTPFYAEGGGQVGDQGVITTETGRAEVVDTQQAVPGLTVHRARLVQGELWPGQDALAAIDLARREATRRHHTGTHLLHAALREVLGDHVHQQGSLVAPDRLRFDFSHPAALAPEELQAVVELVNQDVLSDAPVEVVETSREEADRLGALAFFGDRYGERVRVVRAGPRSVELCGGTHVPALGMIGPLTVVSEGSIGSGTRRIEAVAGPGALARLDAARRTLEEAAGLLKVEPDRVLEALERLVHRQREQDRELARLRSAALATEAAALAEDARDGLLVARRDDLPADALRELAALARRARDLRAVVLAGSPGPGRAQLACATDGSLHAGELVKAVAGRIGGGGGGSPEVAVAGGRNPEGIEDALQAARELLAAPGSALLGAPGR